LLATTVLAVHFHVPLLHIIIFIHQNGLYTLCKEPWLSSRPSFIITHSKFYYQQ